MDFLDETPKKQGQKDSFLDLSSDRNKGKPGKKKDDSLDFLDSGKASKKSDSLNFGGAKDAGGLDSFLETSRKVDTKAAKRKASDSLDFGDDGAADSFLGDNNKKSNPSANGNI